MIAFYYRETVIPMLRQPQKDCFHSQRVGKRKHEKKENWKPTLNRLKKWRRKRSATRTRSTKQVHRTSSDDAPGDVKHLINKHSSTRRPGSKRRLAGSMSGSQKSKRARLSSGSSEPLSPEEHSSAASTPTTPKVTSSIPEEEGGKHTMYLAQQEF